MKESKDVMSQRRILAENIKRLLDSKGKTQTEMARDLDYSETTVSSWMNCARYPRIDKIQELADYFGVYRSDITEDKGSKQNSITSSRYAYYPAEISAGTPDTVDAITDASDIHIPDNMMGKWAGNSDIYVTRINGDSMNNIIPDKSLIAVKRLDLNDLKDGDIVVYSYDNEYGVKRYYKNGNDVVFRPDSTNMSFTDRVIDTTNGIDLKIKGKVVLYIVELD